MICNFPWEAAVSQFNLPTDVAVNIVTMHTLLYSGLDDYDTNNDIISTKVSSTAPWSGTGFFEHNLEPGYGIVG